MADLEKAIAYVQHHGTLVEQARLRDVAPPWAMPGDLAAILYLTANSGFCLARLALPEGLWHSPLLRTYPVARCESLVLSRSIRTGLPRLFVPAKAPGRRCLSLHDARIPMKHPLLENATHLLEQKQKEDGRWESDDGPPFDVRTTLEVIRVMLLGK